MYLKFGHFFNTPAEAARSLSDLIASIARLRPQIFANYGLFDILALHRDPLDSVRRIYGLRGGAAAWNLCNFGLDACYKMTQEWLKRYPDSDLMLDECRTRDVHHQWLKSVSDIVFPRRYHESVTALIILAPGSISPVKYWTPGPRVPGWRGLHYKAMTFDEGVHSPK